MSSAALNSYILPDGNVQISFSGGRTSAYMLHQIALANGGIPDRVRVVFANTGREMPETLDFVQECSVRWSISITWVEFRRHDDPRKRFEVVTHNSASRSGEPFEALIRKKRYLPNQNTRFCTGELKVRPAKEYLLSTGWDKWVAAIGIRADEPTRVKRDLQKECWQRWYPLADAGVSKHTVAMFWRQQPFDLRLPNVNGNCWLGNCDGCFLKSEANLAALTRDYPERAQWWEDMEDLATSLTSGSGANWSKRYSRAELRDFMSRQTDAFDTEDGQLCQASGGDCVA
ncbi:MAG: phosphoadenosine phosphosulfate reductase family protein [Pseudomonadota bacterium]